VIAVLARQYPGESIPSVSTTSRILRQAGFKTRLHRQSSDGFPPTRRQFTPVEPNDLWIVHFKGWWRMLDGTRAIKWLFDNRAHSALPPDDEAWAIEYWFLRARPRGGSTG